MAVPDGKLGDPFSSREETVRQMFAEIGRDTSSLDFTAAAPDASAGLDDDPDVHVAWDCLRQVTAEQLAKFELFNTYAVEIEPDANGRYVVPSTPAGDTWDADVFRQPGTNVSLIAGVRIIQQPPGLNLVWRGVSDTTYTLVNTSTIAEETDSGDDEDFSDYGKCYAEVTYWLRWENIPFPYRNYIFIRAARRFARRVLGEGANIQLSAQDEFDARADARKYRLKSNPVSFQRGSLAWVNDRLPY